MIKCVMDQRTDEAFLVMTETRWHYDSGALRNNNWLYLCSENRESYCSQMHRKETSL